MKVILIKDCKDGKKNQIIDVSNGYGSNYLIKNKIAVPYNSDNLAILQRDLNKIKREKEIQHIKNIELRNELQNIVLNFESKADAKGELAHSISSKKIYKELENLNYKIDKHTFEHIHITTFGTHKIKGIINKEVEVELTIKITQIH